MFPLLNITQGGESTVYIAILLGGLVLVYLSILRPMMRRNKDPLEKPAVRSNLAQQRAVEREMQGLLVEYEQMIRNMTAGLDTRAAKLEALIREAEEAIKTIRALLAELGQRAGDAKAAPTSSSSAAGSIDSAAPLLNIDIPAPARESARPDPRNAEVYALADQGLSAKEVARKLGVPDGEIDLILRLRSSGA